VAGDLLWQDQFDPAGGFDAVMAVAATNGRVAAVGSSQNAAGDTDFVVRVYDAETGALVWSDRIDIAGGNDAATALVADDDRIIVAGTGVDASRSNQLILRTYAPNGQLAWEDRTGILTATSLAAQGTLVIVGGTRTATTGPARLIVRAYLVKTGALAWQDEPAPPQGYQSFSAATRGVALHGSMAFVAGTVRQPAPSFNPNCLLRAYDVRDGELIWESLPPSPCQALAVATYGKRVIVTGQGGAALDDLRIQSFDADRRTVVASGVRGSDRLQ
jgi:outer membrane protein assembly factor BamB